jgi:hypothetical protein
MADVQKEIALKVTTDTSQTNTAFKSAREELKQTQRALVDMALAGKQGTAEFREMEKRAGVLRDTIGDVNRRVTNLANDTPKLQILSEAATAIAGGFAAAQGAAALFGDENEEVQQAILKTQGAVALLNGVQAVANSLNKDSALMMSLNATATRAYSVAVGASTGALKLFRLALISTGIGAAVVAVGMLVANFDKVKAAVMGFVEQSKPLQVVLNFLTEGFTKLGRAIGIIPSESEAATKQMIEDLEKQKKLLEAAGADTFAISKRLAELRIQLAKQTGKGLAEAEEELTLLTAKEYKKREDLDKEATKKKIENSLKARQQVIADLTTEMNFRRAIGEEALDLEETILREKLKYAQLTNTGIMQAQADLRLFLQREQIQREKDEEEAFKKRSEKLIQDNIKLAAIDEERRRASLTDFQRRIEDIKADSLQRIELLRATGASENEVRMEQNRAVGLITKAFLDEEDKKHKEAAEKKELRDAQMMQNNIDLTKGGLQAIADVTLAFAGQSEAAQRRAFDMQKRVNIAMALIDTFVAAQKAYLSQMQFTPDSPIRAAIAAGVAVASGLARVAAIRNTTFGAASTSAAPQAIRPAGIPQPQAPAAFNPNTSTPNVPIPTTPQGQPMPLRAYVVDRDIETASTRRNRLRDFAGI